MENGQNHQMLQKLQSTCTIKIEYDESIRSIDLENLLSGIRMILQHELAERTNAKSRDFTDLTRITSIEKGSIDITLFFDWVHVNLDAIQVNLDLLSVDFDVVDLLLLYFGRDRIRQIPEKLKVHVRNFKSSIGHFKNVLVKSDKQSATIAANNNDELDININ